MSGEDAIGFKAEGLADAESGSWGDLVAFCLKRVLNLLRHGTFYPELVRTPLVVNPGGFEAFGEWFLEIDATDDGLEGLSDDGRTAGGTDGEDGLAVFEHDGGAHAGKRAFARGDGVGSGA